MIRLRACVGYVKHLRLKERLKEYLALKGNIPALALRDFVSTHAWMPFEVIWQPFVLSLNATLSILGSLGSLHYIIRFGSQLFTGRVSDAIGRKRIQVFASIFTISTFVICFVAHSWELLISGVILYAFSYALWEPAGAAMVAESVAKKDRGIAYSLIELTWVVPGFYAPIIFGYLAEILGFSPIFVIILPIEFLALLILLIFIKETLPVKQKLDFRDMFTSLKEIVRPKFRLIRFYVFAIVITLSWSMQLSIFFGMVYNTYHLTYSQLGAMYTAACVVKALFQLPAGKIIDKYGRKHVLLLSEIVGLVVVTGYLLSQDFQGFLLSYALFGLFSSLFNPAYLAYLSDATPTEERAKTMGDLNALKGLIAFPAPFIGGFLYDQIGFHAPILANFTLLVIALLPLIAVEER